MQGTFQDLAKLVVHVQLNMMRVKRPKRAKAKKNQSSTDQKARKLKKAHNNAMTFAKWSSSRMCQKR